MAETGSLQGTCVRRLISASASAVLPRSELAPDASLVSPLASWICGESTEAAAASCRIETAIVLRLPTTRPDH